MKRFLLLFALCATCFSLLASNAEAKRFGGGSSIGKQRSISPQQTQKAPAAAPAPAAPGTPPQPAGNKWLGPLAGLAIGLGLGALFSSMGVSEGMGMLMMIIAGAALLLFLFSMLRRRAQPAMQYAGAGAPYQGHPPAQQAAGAAQTATGGRIPAGFPVEAFLRSAKTSFIRLQAANDRKDLNDIRGYTTPEMFAEISMQISERDNAPQQTDVLSLNAELLEVVSEGDYAVASVRMSGQLRENHTATENFDEVWHVQKDVRDQNAVWLLSGIQQIG